MKSYQFIFVVLVSFFIGISNGYGQQTAEQLFQSGLYKEEIQGDLNAAIKIFESIINQYPENRSVAAKTQLHIGLCYEKLGNTEARKAYERVLLKYSDQGDIAAQARSRLTVLSETAVVAPARVAKDLTLTKIYAGSAYAASISPDGKRLAVIRPELSSRDIWIRDIETGKEVRLTNFINSKADVVWSPDSHWIAFSDRDRDIKVVSTDGGLLQTLFTLDPNSLETSGITVTGWTADSRKVIFQIPSKGLFTVSVTGKVAEPVFTFESPEEAMKYEAMTLSPDGRWIAYSASQNGNTDIFVMSPARQVPVRITTNPAADRKPRWSPDGNWLVFTSSGTENPQIWAIKISPNGEPDGLPVQITKDAYVLGGDWTGDANIGFSAAFRSEHIFTANADGTGETQVTQFASFNTAPQWSPNGDRIAFRSDYRKPLNKFQLWTVPSAGGTPRLVSDMEAGGFRWSADGEKLFFRTRTGSNQSVSMEIRSRGGEPKEIMPLPGEANVMGRSPDGKSIAYTFTVEPAQFSTADEYMKERMSGIGITPKGGGESRILIPADKKGIWYSDCRLDPEGKRIAYIMSDYTRYGKEDMNTIWTMDVNGGTPRQIARGGEYSLCWTPDAKWIVFEKRISDMDFELYKVPANGGEPVKMNIRGRSPQFSPDGKKIAYSRRVESGYEFWLVKNFAAQSGAKLAAHGSSVGNDNTGGLAVHRILADASGIHGYLTADGKYIRTMEKESGDVIQFEIAGRKMSRITNRGPWSTTDTVLGEKAFSRDGNQIAYDIKSHDPQTNEWIDHLMIRNLDGSNLRKLFSKKDCNLYPLDWSPDGSSILALIDHDKGNELTLISTIDGSIHVLRSIINAWAKAGFSPDGRYIAFHSMDEVNQPQDDIRLITADGRDEVVVAGHPAMDRLLGWTPDGRRLVFFSDRAGTWDIWTVRINGGKQEGEPELLKRDFGYNSFNLGFAPDGSFYYMTGNTSGHLYYGTIDLETGKVLVPPVSVTTRLTSPPVGLTWSPDGKYLAYTSFRGSTSPSDFILTIRSATTGEERFLPPRLAFVEHLSWAPDSRSIIALGFIGKEFAIFRINAETGDTLRLGEGMFPRLCPDGKTLLFADGPVIRKRDLNTGEESEVVNAGTGGTAQYFYDLSPDGREVVFQQDNTVKTVSINGGESKELFRGSAPYYRMRWTGDGRYIIAQAITVGERESSGITDTEIWRIPVKGGIPLRLDLFVPKLAYFSLHPDNRRFAFSIKEESGSELWVMDNFLPLEKIKGNASAMTVTRVLEKTDVTGKVSTDGRIISCTFWETGDIGFHDLIMGQKRRLTDGSNPDAIIEYSVPSPDGKSIAYYWNNNDSYDLRVVGLDGSKPKVLKASGKEIHHFVPIAWTPDSKFLLTEFVKADGNSEMMLLTVADGSARLLKEKGKGLPPDGYFSPDGRYIAWSTREGISLFELKTGTESLLMKDPSNHSVLGWAPDGKYVMFSSERTGSPDAWLIAVADGKAGGEPLFIKKNWGFQPMGITHSGAFYYAVNNNLWGIKIAGLNSSGGKVVTPLQSAFKHGNMRSPDWSPDGHFLAGVDANEPSQAVIIHSMETGEERELKVGGWIIGMGQLRWTPDGKAIVVAASQAGKGENLIRIDVQTGQVTSLMTLPALGGWAHFSFSKDGNIIYYTRPDSSNRNEFTPVAHDLRSGKETIVPVEQGNVSPDGKYQLTSKSLDGYKTQSLYIKPVNGGEERELVKASRVWATWSPDSRYVVFLKDEGGQVAYKDTKWHLWRIAAEGGEPEPMGMDFTGRFIGSLKISPDGRYVVIDDATVNLEVWKMENFLPK